MSIDIDRHINMIKSFRNAHSECGDYIPYMMPHENYHTYPDRWVDLPSNELLLVEISGDGTLTAENITVVRQSTDMTIEVSFYTKGRVWVNSLSCTIKWGDTCVYTNISFDPFLLGGGLDAVKLQLGVIYGQLQFLSEPTIHADYIDPSPYVQKARADRGKRPLPAYRVIRPGQTVMHYRKGDAAGGTKVEADSESSEKFKGRGKGVPKSPHWNPGCTYAKKNGRIVHKRPYPVKGGKCPNPIPVLALKPNEVQFVSD
ncbi:hypothetical protein [Magnetospirillum sp. 15-1]|uniref:hypothetical protein n=1 Tax=Magnetospirillum sp. 15-1 TaxID=1979370 RepID=UPI0011437A10|nr:hypothetical protein [Magnetospirillum sp. 15-1]